MMEEFAKWFVIGFGLVFLPVVIWMVIVIYSLMIEQITNEIRSRKAFNIWPFNKGTK